MTDETRIFGVARPSGVGEDSVMWGLVRRNPRISVARRAWSDVRSSGGAGFC